MGGRVQIGHHSSCLLGKVVLRDAKHTLNHGSIPDTELNMGFLPESGVRVYRITFSKNSSYRVKLSKFFIVLS